MYGKCIESSSAMKLQWNSVQNNATTGGCAKYFQQDAVVSQLQWDAASRKCCSKNLWYEAPARTKGYSKTLPRKMPEAAARCKTFAAASWFTGAASNSGCHSSGPSDSFEGSSTPSSTWELQNLVNEGSDALPNGRPSNSTAHQCQTTWAINSLSHYESTRKAEGRLARLKTMAWDGSVLPSWKRAAVDMFV